ncbi:MAG: pilin [bacterium]|nr:pilin [bacterium]
MLLSFILPQPVFAQATCAQQYPDNCPARVSCQITKNERHFIRSTSCICSGDCALNDFVGLAIEVSRYIFGITGSLALIMFAVGGFWWLTAAGTADRIEKGKKTLVAAVVGILIIFGAWVIVNTLLAALTGQIGAGPVKLLGGNWWQPPQ